MPDGTRIAALRRSDGVTSGTRRHAMASVELIAVTKACGATVAVDQIDLKIEDGSYCCLLGPSGCGKTSTLRMIADHETVTLGDVLIGPNVVNTLPPAKRGAPVRLDRAVSGGHSCGCPFGPPESR